ncbi:META domain-containing protein [Oscillatoria amoena NRMC-F 0135]|nr:META domain-containing protein [Oscillatoria amoena NRMC-F 0135]
MYLIRKYPVYFVFLLPALFLVSCKAQEISLQSTKWKLVHMEGEDLTILKEPVTLVFNDDKTRISGFGGCNSYFGSYRISGNEIIFSQLGSTKMFCLETQKIEDAFFRLLPSVDSCKTKDDTLQLTKDGRVILEFVKSK